MQSILQERQYVHCTQRRSLNVVDLSVVSRTTIQHMYVAPEIATATATGHVLAISACNYHVQVAFD